MTTVSKTEGYCELNTNSLNHKKDRSLTFREEIRDYQFWKAVRCELLGTMIYVFFGCALTNNNNSNNNNNNFSGTGSFYMSMHSAIGFGFAMATMVQCVGHVSGAHLNPATSVAMVITRNVTLLRSALYVTAQCVGALLGVAVLYGVRAEALRDCRACTVVQPGTALSQAFGTEFLVTFTVVLTVFANTEQNRVDTGTKALSIGFAVMLGILFAAPLTGAGMNPARSLATAVFSNQWRNHWVYWLGPVLGGVFGGFTYEYTRDSSEQIQRIKRSFRVPIERLTRSHSTRSVQSNVSVQSHALTEVTVASNEVVNEDSTI